MSIEASKLAYQDNGVECIGHLVLPDTSDRRPGVAIFADISGVGPQPIARAHRIAEEFGCVALAADIYGGGKVITDLGEGMPGVQDFMGDPDRLAKRAGAALDALARHPRCDGRLVAIGFCFGGAAVLALARSGRKDLLAGATFHGNLATPKKGQGKIAAKLLICHGSEDPFVPQAELADFLAEMTAADADCQTIVYSGVGHSFTLPSAADLGIPGVAYDEKADRASWASFSTFLKSNLGL